MDKKYKPKEFSEMLNVSVKTLQRWDNDGILPEDDLVNQTDFLRQFANAKGLIVDEVIEEVNEKLSPKEEMIQDLTSIIHVFSCRIYGLKIQKTD